MLNNLTKFWMEAKNETVTIKSVTMICSVIGFTVTMLIGFSRIVDGAVEKGVSNAVETIHLKQNITDQRQDNRIEAVSNETKSNKIEIEKIKDYVYIERSRK